MEAEAKCPTEIRRRGQCAGLPGSLKDLGNGAEFPPPLQMQVRKAGDPPLLLQKKGDSKTRGDVGQRDRGRK